MADRFRTSFAIMNESYCAMMLAVSQSRMRLDESREALAAVDRVLAGKHAPTINAETWASGDAR